MEARLGKVRIALQIDVGLGDSIVSGPEELEYPTLLKFPAPRLHAYSKESVVAEKFEAMVKLGIANSRMKDFYDLWVLAQRFEFDSANLAAAIQATFERPGVQRCRHRRQWPCGPISMIFQRSRRNGGLFSKSRAPGNSSLHKIILIIQGFVMSVVEGILKNDIKVKVWPAGGPWKTGKKLS